MPIVTRLRTGVATWCVAVLAATPALAQTPASAVLAEQQRPDLTLKVVNGRLTVEGAQSLRAGRVEIAVRASYFERGQAVGVAALGAGYTVRDARADFVASSKGDMKALKRLFAKVDFLGGLAVGRMPNTATIVLPRAGTYTAWLFRGRGPTSPVTLQAGAVRRTQAPDIDGRVIGRSGHQWGGSTHFPTKGTLLFTNKGDQPHFLWMQRVEDGTTTDQVLESLPGQEQPDWVRPGSIRTEAISPGRSMTVGYELPPGQYVQLCLIGDPTMKGMPHAFAGMARMVHVM